jgi:hypothetical protein
MLKKPIITEDDMFVIHYLRELSRNDRLKLLFIMEDMKNGIIRDECAEEAHKLIERIKQ